MAKYKLFESAGSAVINIDDETGRQFAGSVTCRKFTYSAVYNSADFVAKDIKQKPSGGQLSCRNARRDRQGFGILRRYVYRL